MRDRHTGNAAARTQVRPLLRAGEGCRLTVEISVQLRPDVALALQGLGAGAPEAEELQRRAEELGIQLQPMHPGETDPLLVPYFYVAAPDSEAERIAAELAVLPGVDGAYVKPAAEPP